MDFDELGPPDHDHPLLDHLNYNNNNQSFRRKRILIIVAGISLTIIIIVLTVTMLLIYTRKQHRKPLPFHEFITPTNLSTRVTTVFSTTTTELEMSSKQSFVVLYL